MQELGPFDEARNKVLANAQRLLHGVQRVVAEPVDSVEAAMAVLAGLRRQAQEDLNQIQHEQMIVCAAAWLQQHGIVGSAARWHWNPRHGGDRAGPDLLAKDGDGPVVVAEVAASEDPVGVIDAQMRRSLAKLVALEGRRFYFVRTASMKRRAASKVIKAGWDVAVVQIALLPAAAPPPLGLTQSSLAAASGVR